MSQTIFEEIGGLLLMILAGMLGWRLKLISKEQETSLNHFMLNICVPCFMIKAISNIELLSDHAFLLRFLSVTAVAFLTLLLVGLLGSRLLESQWRDRCFYMLSITNCNTGQIGLPVAQLLFGELGVIYAAFFSLITSLILWGIGPYLVRNNRSEPLWRKLCTPIMIGMYIGFALFLLQIRLPGILAATCAQLGDLTGPLAMVVAGCGIAEIGMRNMLRNFKLLKFLLIKQFLLPAVMALVLLSAFHGIREAQIAVVLLSMPTAVCIVPFAQDYEYDVAHASEMVCGSTVLSLFVLPFLMRLMSL